MDKANLQNYIKFLKVIQEKVDIFFDNQKEYIACKEGCGLCCKNAEFPFTEVEFDYALEGFFKLDKEIQMEIMDKVEKVIQDKKKFKEQNKEKAFLYDCPFLINNKCSIYFNRGLICRTFGLVSYEKGDKLVEKIPFCTRLGLNYASVFDLEKGEFSKEKFEKTNNKVEPKEFYMSYKRLIDKDFEEGFNFKYGDVKPLIDFFEEV